MGKEKYDNCISVTEEELIEFWGETPESLAELERRAEMWERGEIPPGTTEVRMGRPRLEDLCEPVAFSHKEPPGKAAMIRTSAKRYNQTLSEFWREASTLLLQQRGELKADA